jgi:hypothetical protein
MDHHANDFASALERFTAQLQDLERRVSALEGDEKKSAPKVAPLVVSPTPETAQTETIASTESVSLVSILGKATLGMAGAYLLRAAAESEIFPKLAVVGAALVYAWIWQFLSVRAGKGSRAAGAVYGITSALILFPMLWEITLRFKILPASVTAGLLVASVISAMILAWGTEATATIWATTIFSAATTLGLLVVTRDPLPFALALILTAAITEFVACREHWLSLRIAAAVSLDLALCAVLYVATRPGGFPDEYTPVSIPALLFLFTAPLLISASAAGYRTIRLHRRMASLDIAQTIVTFVLLFTAVLQLGGSTAAKTFGLFCFLASAACYLAAFLHTEIQSDSRNFQVCAAWAGALFLFGSYLAIPASALSPWLSLSAILATVLAPRTKRLTLGFHGFLWLIAAQIASGLMLYAGQLYVGSYPLVAPPMAWLVALSATVCSFILLLRAWHVRGIRVLRFCSVANTSFLLSAFAVSGIVAVLHGWGPVSVPRLALIRTLVICAATLALALIGSRLKRRELVGVAYTAIGLGTLKLLLEDLRLGNTGSFALSLLAFGVLLAVIPRLVRGGSRGKKTADPA